MAQVHPVVVRHMAQVHPVVGEATALSGTWEATALSGTWEALALRGVHREALALRGVHREATALRSVYQGGYRTQECIPGRLSPLKVFIREATALKGVDQGGYLLWYIPTMVYTGYAPLYIRLPPSFPVYIRSFLTLFPSWDQTGFTFLVRRLKSEGSSRTKGAFLTLRINLSRPGNGSL